VSLLARARKFIEEKEAWREGARELEDLREKAERLGVRPSPFEKLQAIDWPCALEAAALGFLRCGRIPDSDSLDAAAALVLYLADASEKQEKGEKPEIRYGLTEDEARAFLARIFLGRPARLTEVGQIETVDG
jgi:hypothetical protein